MKKTKWENEVESGREVKVEGENAERQLELRATLDDMEMYSGIYFLNVIKTIKIQ